MRYVTSENIVMGRLPIERKQWRILQQIGQEPPIEDVQFGSVLSIVGQGVQSLFQPFSNAWIATKQAEAQVKMNQAQANAMKEASIAKSQAWASTLRYLAPIFALTVAGGTLALVVASKSKKKKSDEKKMGE